MPVCPAKPADEPPVFDCSSCEDYGFVHRYGSRDEITATLPCPDEECRRRREAARRTAD